MKKKVSRIQQGLTCSALALACVLSGCSTEKPDTDQTANKPAHTSAAYPQEYDSCGTKVVLDKRPEKIIAAGRMGVANLVAAGGADRMIGRYAEHGAEQSPEVEAAVKDIKQLESSTGEAHAELSFEAILKLQPDMIYGEGIGSDDYEVSNLEKYKIKGIVPKSACVYITNVDEVDRADLKGITKNIRELGKLIDSETTANQNADKLEQELKEAEEAGKDLKEMTVAGLYYWDASDDLFAYGANSTLQGIFNIAKLKNVVDPKYDAMMNGAIQPEAIMAANPEVIVITTGEGGITFEDSISRLKKIPGMDKVDAIKNNRIIELPSGAAYPIADAIHAAKTTVNARQDF